MKRLFILLTVFIAVTQFASAQKIITGTVTSADDGSFLPGVSVLVKGTTIGTVTDIDGKYTLTVPNDSLTLVFSFVGMRTVETKITGTIVNTMLNADDVRVEEVVVTGYSVKIRGIASGMAETSHKGIYSRADKGSKNEKAGLLTAGEVNDFNKWNFWTDIAENDLQIYQKNWKIKPLQRYCVQLTDKSGMPVLNGEITLFDSKNNPVWVSKTDNTGKAELWANMFDSVYSPNENFTIEINYLSKKYFIYNPVKFHDGVNSLTLPVDIKFPQNAEIAFVVDATGSMGDEIEYLKAELSDIMQKAAKKCKKVDFNLGSVFYRDKGDQYLTRSCNLSDNLNSTFDFIKNQSAGGGGDFPESVDIALDSAINNLSWSNNCRARIVFLILDAPPHQEPVSVAKIQAICKQASAKGIRIVPVTCSGIDKNTEYLMRSIALCSNGTYTFLTDDSGIGGSHIKPTTDKYDVETLNDLLVRIIKQYTTVPENYEFKMQQLDTIISVENIPDTTMLNNQNETVTDRENETKESLKKAAGIKYYPNPTSGQLFIEPSAKISELFITDNSGKILSRINITDDSQIVLHLDNYPSGIYYLQYHYKNKAQSGKIILQH